MADHSAGDVPNVPADVVREKVRRDRHPTTNSYEIVSQFILNPRMQKVSVMICWTCSVVQLCNSEQKGTKRSSAEALQ